MFTKLALRRRELPVLRTERLLLRPLVPSDDEVIFRFLNDAEVIQYLNRVHLPTKLRARRLLKGIWISNARHESVHFGICLVETGQLIGVISFQEWKEERKEAQIGYMFDRGFWGQGYGTEAVGRVLRFGFDELGLTRIEGKCHINNQRSQKVLIKNGMRYERTQKHFSLFQKNGQDVLVYVMEKMSKKEGTL